MKRLFPLQKKALGIDIADHTLTLVELVKNSGGSIHISGFSQTRIPPSVVMRGRIRDEEKLQEIIQKALVKFVKKPAKSLIGVFGIPESQVYTHVFQAKPHTHEEIDTIIQDESLRTIPIERADMVVAHEVLSQDQNATLILLIATQRNVLNEWSRFFQKLNITIPAYESEILATYRGLQTSLQKGSLCLVDIGATTSTIAVFYEHGILAYLYSFEGAGDELTESIAKALHVSFEEAEKVKKTLDMENPPTNLAALLPSYFDRIISEIITAQEYVSRRNDKKIDRIVLVGGTSRAKGLTNYIAEKTGLQAHLGESLFSEEIKSIRLAFKQDDTNAPPIEAIGLALRLLDKRYLHNSAFFKSPSEEERSAYYENRQEARKEGGARELLVDRPTEFQDVLKERKVIHRQLIVLFFVLLIGVGAIVFAFWYQQFSQKQKEERIRTLTPQYTNIQYIDASIPLLLGEERGDTHGIRGRLYRFPLLSGDVTDAVATEAQIALRRQLNQGEDFFHTPLNDTIGEPVRATKALVYAIFDTLSLRAYITDYIRRINVRGIPFEVGAIEYQSIRGGTTPLSLLIDVKITVSSTENLSP